MEVTYCLEWLEFLCASLQVCSCWPVILVQALGIYWWHWHQTGNSGMDWCSPAQQLFFKALFTSLASLWPKMLFPFSNRWPHQPSVDQVFQSESHGLSNQTPGCGTSPVNIYWFATFHRPFETPSLWPGWLMKNLSAVQSLSPLLPGLCNPFWYSSDCFCLYHWCPCETTAADNSQWTVRGLVVPQWHPWYDPPGK